MARAFVIRPFGKKKDSSGLEIDFERVHEELIDPSLKATGLGGGTTGEIVDSGNIREDMFALILEADLVVMDASNPEELEPVHEPTDISNAWHSNDSLYWHFSTLHAPTPAVQPASPPWLPDRQNVSHRGKVSSPMVMAGV